MFSAEITRAAACRQQKRGIAAREGLLETRILMFVEREATPPPLANHVTPVVEDGKGNEVTHGAKKSGTKHEIITNKSVPRLIPTSEQTASN